MISVLYNDNNEILSIKYQNYNEESVELIDLYNYYKFTNVIGFFKAIFKIDISNENPYMLRKKDVEQNMAVYLNPVIDTDFLKEEVSKYNIGSNITVNVNNI